MESDKNDIDDTMIKSDLLTELEMDKPDSIKTNLTQFEWHIQSNYYILNNFYDGLAAFKDDNGYGFINEKEEVVIKPQYQMTFGFTDGLACVKKGGKYGYIDKNGNVKIPFKFDSGVTFQMDLLE